MGKFGLYLAVIVATIFSGCGGGSGSSTSTITQSSSSSSSSASSQAAVKRSVTVIDEYVIGAKVSDCNGVSATTDSKGVATAAFDSGCPLVSEGGKLDIDGNGIVDDTDIPALAMKSPAGKDTISPLTDLVAKGADEAKLAAILGITPQDIYKDPFATNNVALAKAIQIAYVVELTKKSNDFIAKINGQQAQTTTTQSTGNLPNMGHYESSSSSSVSSVNHSIKSNLPSIGSYRRLYSNLPTFDYDNDATSENEAMESESSSSSATKAEQNSQQEANNTTTVAQNSQNTTTTTPSTAQNSECAKDPFGNSICENNATQSSSSVASAAPSVEQFAKVAEDILKDEGEAVNFIEEVKNIDVDNVKDFQQAISNAKIELYKAYMQK